MRSSRTHQSVSSLSSASYLSSRTRHRSCSHTDSTKKPSRKMKFIIAIGIALPIIAAIIGVVAWAVSADSSFHRPLVSSLRRSDLSMENHEEDIFQALEDRHDIEYSRHFSQPNKNLEKQDFSRLDTADNENQFDDTANKDPLYIVHFVPSPKPKVESSSSDTNLVSTVSNEVLQKILSASKGTKPGTPQFVVFAPVPEEEDAKNEAGSLSIGSQGLNLFKNAQGKNAAIDYDYEEELRKYQELLDSSDQPPPKDTSRVGTTKENAQTQTESIKEAVKLVTQNFTAGNVYQSHQYQTPNSGIVQNANYNQQQTLQQQQQQSLTPQLNYQQNSQGYPQGLTQGISQGYAQQPVQQVQNYDQQQYQQPVQQVQNYDQQQYQQQYFPQESNNAVQVHPHQPHATDRSGYAPVGIKLSFGGGRGRGLLGGNYSPLGIIGSILRPLLPRPQVNLNGKLMFGVVLEKGVKFGDQHQKGGATYR